MSAPDSKKQRAARSTIGRRLASVVLIAIATTILLVTLANSWREATRYAAVKTSEIEGTAHVFASAVSDGVAAGDRVAVLKTLRAIARIPSFSHASVHDLTGKSLAELGSAVALEEKADLPIFLRRTLEVHVPVVKGGKKVGRLSVLVNTDDLHKRLIDGLLTGLAAALLSGAIGVAIAYRLQKRITEPLRRLTQTMSDVQNTQNFEQIVDHDADDETGVLVTTFNRMLAEIGERDDRLARHREQLEHKVEERTHDLKTAKDAAEEANAAKSDFLATMSHEIRTPMNGMLVMAELLASANLTDRHRRYADVVVKSGQSLLTIINDILDFSKIESGKLDLECITLEPAAVVDDVLNLFWEKAAGKNLDLAGYVAPDVPDTIQGDPVRLNQVLSNLVNNALKFTEQGHVKVAVSTVPAGSDGAPPALRFGVSDTGIGIAEDKLATVFESFSQADQTTTRRFGGTGLGLAICKRLVRAMGGDISVTSAEGQGSEFFFTMTPSAAVDVADTSAQRPARSLKKAVVAVAGSATSRVLVDYLQDRGIEAATIDAPASGASGAGDADLVLAEPELISSLAVGGQAGSAAETRYVVSVSQLGDANSDRLIESGQVHDLLMRPVSRQAFHDLVDRLDAGSPRGRAVLEKQESSKLPSFAGASVLVADDSPVNREVIIEALKQLDIKADVVEHGAAAVQAANQKQYDLIFMDCSMPEMDGFEATRRIRSTEEETARARVPVIALTAQIAGGSADEWQRAGMDDYLTKPFRITDLVTAFDEFLPEELRHETAAPEREEYPAQADDTSGPSKAETLPVIDKTVLDALAGCQAGEGGDLLVRVLSLFEQHAPPALLKLAESARDEGCPEIADAAHALKSMCRNIGAVRLGEACDRLEAEARSGKIDRLTAQLSHLQSELTAVLVQTDRIRNNFKEEHLAAGV